MNTGNFSLSTAFIRRCLQWLTVSSSEDFIRVCVIVNDVDDGTVGVLDDTENTSVFRGELRDLSDASFLSDFDCMIFCGLDNDISPLIRTNIKSFVASGGGVLFSDVNVNSANIEMFDDISTVYSIGAGVNLDEGASLWTSEGLSHYLYNSDFSTMTIPVLNTVSELGFSDGWDLIYVYDTGYVFGEDQPQVEILGTIYSSADYDIPGSFLVGYFAAVYENGLFKIES